MAQSFNTNLTNVANQYATLSFKKNTMTFFNTKLFLFFLLSLFPGVFLGQNIILRSSNTLKGKTYIYYIDMMIDSKTPFIISGKSEERIQSSYPLFLFEADSMQNSFLVYPNDTLTVSKNKEHKTILKIEGNAQRNSELLFFPQLTKKMGAVYGIKPTAKYLSISNFEKRCLAIDNDMAERLSYLEWYAQNNNVSLRFYETVRSYFIFLAKFTKIYVELTLYNRLSIEKKAFYKDTINVTEFINYYNCDSCLNTFQFYRGGAVFLNKFLQRDRIGKPNEISALYNSAIKNFSGQTKDYLLFRLLKDNIESSADTIKMYAEKFQVDCDNQTYKDNLNNELSLKSGSFQNDSCTDILFTQTSEKICFSDIKRLNKGKLIFLDFWASWCVPCKEEMKESEKLEKSYRNEKIKFIYISLDKSKSSWKEASEVNAKILNSGNSYLLLNGFNSFLAKELKIQTIPRYILLGNDGNILRINEMRPSNSKLQVLLNQLLRKQK